MIHREDRARVAILRFEHGKSNALDTELLQALELELAKIADSDMRAVVLTGTDSMFSAGVDLFRVIKGGAEYLDEFLPALTRVVEKLFQFDRPVVGAVNGHAIAGGCVLVCACDHRVMVNGAGRIGTPEIHVGVPFPTLALEIMRFVAPPEHLQEILTSGRTFTPDEALQYGLVDELVSSDALLEHALQRAERLGALRPATFAITKRQLRAPTLERFSQKAGPDDALVHETWKAPETIAFIENYVERTLKKSTG